MATLTGVQPVVVICANRRPPATTMEQVRAAMVRDAALWQASSYGVYSLKIDCYGWFQLPTDMPCNAQAYGDAAVRMAVESGVVIPPGASIWVWSDCGHYEALYRCSLPDTKLGVFSDGKMFAYLYGSAIGLPTARAEVLPPVGSNAFDPYTPMGYMGKGGLNAHERWQKGWLPAANIIADADTTQSIATRFIETTERPLGTKIKLWRLANQIEIDFRAIGKPGIVTLHRGNTILDLDPVGTCRQYSLPVGTIYTLGDGLGIRCDSIATDGSGATVTVFPYTGPITVKCAGPK